MLKIYQPYFTDDQIKSISPIAIPLYANNNLGNTTREYELFKKIAHQFTDENDVWGLVSQKFSHKSFLPLDSFYQFADKKMIEGFDCAFINPLIGTEALFLNVWEQGEECGHKGLLPIAQYLEQVLGTPLLAPMGKDVFAFCNYFVANKKFWSEYFKFIDQSIEALEKEAVAGSAIGKIYSGPASYIKDPHATMKPFVIERLFSSFIQNSKFKVAPYLYEKQGYKNKFGDKYGEFLFQISSLKNTGLKFNFENLLMAHTQIRSFLYKNSAFMVSVSMLDEPPDFFLTKEFDDLMAQDFTQ